ncbi:hypothetical protein LHK_02884 [Laribacter hongkongensis HLHK9]|uniref:Uncharacterized protein n=1 Tax=Laribacter hongkongensis (strain HLHK9) TaxID=557598 RepID=C1D4S1_LARHH|nr:hypothetical protein LHK_02884 [Laribacter hongkongensis HLHK9]
MKRLSTLFPVSHPRRAGATGTVCCGQLFPGYKLPKKQTAVNLYVKTAVYAVCPQPVHIAVLPFWG